MEEPLEIKIIKPYASETIQPQLLFVLNIPLKFKQFYFTDCLFKKEGNH